MARTVHVYLTDDLDGSDADETMTFALDGVTYEIDVSEKNAAQLRSALAGYIRAGRKAGRATSNAPGRVTRRPTTRTVTDRTQTKAIRDWAKTKKIKLSDRGRIPAEVVARYEREAGR